MSRGVWLCAVAALGVLGCQRGTDVLSDWTLTVDGRSTAVELPGTLQVPEHPLTYRLDTTVAIPSGRRGRSLRLVVPHFDGLLSLRANGHPVPLEDPARTAVYRRRGPHSFPIPAAATTGAQLSLELAVEHRWSGSAVWDTAPRLVAADADPPAARWVELINVFFTAGSIPALALIGASSLLIWLWDRRQRAHLWFAIQTYTAVYYPLWVLGVTQRVLGPYDTAGCSISLLVGSVAALYYVHEFFELGPPSRWWPGTAAVATGLILITSGPFEVMRVSPRLTVAFVTALVIYQLVICVRLVRHHPDRGSAVRQLVGWILFGVCATPDSLAWVGLGDPLGGARLATVGLTIFALLMLVQLTRKHIESQRQADDLNVELRGRVEQLQARGAEVEQLNQELRRQVGERSRQLFQALALGDGGVAPRLVPGSVIHERYRVLRLLGTGGMGAVYQVTRTTDGLPLALKLTRERTAEALARLAREATMAATVQHPSLVGIVDVGVAAGGFVFLIMELVDGPSLQQEVKRWGRPAWALPILTQVAEGLEALHQAGIVHRDLKPANVLLAGDLEHPRVKIGDFGLSLPWESVPSSSEPPASEPPSPEPPVSEPPSPEPQLPGPPPQADDEPSSEPVTVRLAPGAVAGPGESSSSRPSGPPASADLTRTGFLPGTPAYIAPELVKGRQHLSPAADAFSFGVLAFQLLTGESPFGTPPAMSIMSGEEPGQPRALAELVPDLPAELVALVIQCMAMAPEDRPGTDALVERLGRIALPAALRPGPVRADRR